jgi:hypothetical protein
MKKLSKVEMKNVLGGVAAPAGTCASINANGVISYNLTSAQASGVGAGGHWCCASCGTATWYETGCDTVN